MKHISRLLYALTLGIVIIFNGIGLASSKQAPWEAADQIRQAMGRIERKIFRTPDDARRAATIEQYKKAHRAYQDTLKTPISNLSTDLDGRLEEGFENMQKAIDSWSGTAAARASNDIWSGLITGAYRMTTSALDKGDLDTAREWLAIREYARASRDTAASQAMDAAAAGRLPVKRAQQIIESELLRIYANELRRALGEAKKAANNEYAIQLAGSIARAHGLFGLLSDNISARIGEEKFLLLAIRFKQLSEQEIRSETKTLQATITKLEDGLIGYSPVSIGNDDKERLIRLLHRFLGLIYIEYKDGVRDGKVTIAVEYHEAGLFRDKAQLILGDLQGEMMQTSPQDFAKLDAILKDMQQIIEVKGPRPRIKELSAQAQQIVSQVFGFEAGKGGHRVAFQMLPGILDEIVMLVRVGDYPGAELKRLEAYSYFDPDIEQRLVPRSPTLSLKLESLFWEGNAKRPGLGRLLELQAREEQLQTVVVEMKEELNKASELLQAKLGPTGAFIQSFAIILREGLEAILVIAALIGALRTSGATAFAKHIWGGVSAGIAASFALWFAVGRILSISTANRELLEGVTALLAASVLVYVTHWIFHKAYVTDWMSFIREKVHSTASNGHLTAIATLSFFVVFREGFETVLFYEALMIDTSPAPVLAGFATGLIGTAGIAFALLHLGLKLPISTFFKATGFLLMALSIIFVGAGVRGLQTASLVSATPVSGFPEWPFLQLYLGIFPVAEPLIAQGLLLMLFAIGLIWLKTKAKNLVEV